MIATQQGAMQCRQARLPSLGASAARRSGRARRRLLSASASTEDKGNTGVLERPGLDLSQDSAPEMQTGKGSGDYDRTKGTGGGSFRLLLLRSDKHSEARVIGALTTVVPGVSTEHARNCYHTAKQLGMAMITTALKEHAEMYAQQLYSKGCRARIEPDSSTL